MMFVKGKDEALLKSITGIMSKTAQQTEEQRKKAAQYLEKTTYAGMRLEEGYNEMTQKAPLRMKVAAAAKMKEQEAKKAQQQSDKTKKEEVELDFNNLLEYMLTPEFEQLDEISKETLKSYIPKAEKDVKDKLSNNYVSRDTSQKFKRDIANREKGLGRAVARLTKEEFDQLDEISKGTLGSYIKKATSSSDERSISNLSSRAADKLNNPVGNDSGEKDDHKSYLRSKGIARAVNRLTKESVELEEAITSGHLDDLIKSHGFTKTAKAVQSMYDAGHIDKKQADKHMSYLNSHPDKFGSKVYRVESVELEEGIEDRLEAAREKAAAKGKIKEKQPMQKSNVRQVAGKAYGGSKQKEKEEMDESAGSAPKTEREKKLAAMSGDPSKITKGDVLKARGVAKEEVELGEGIKSMVHKFLAKRASKKADDAYDMGDEKEFQKQVDKSEYHRVKAGGKPTRINKNPDAKFLTTREEIELDESVKIIDRDSDLDQEHFKLSVNGKPVHFVHYNYEGGHATDSKQDIHYQVKNQLKHLSDADKKKVTDAVHASYRMKEEFELDEDTLTEMYGLDDQSHLQSGDKVTLYRKGFSKTQNKGEHTVDKVTTHHFTLKDKSGETVADDEGKPLKFKRKNGAALDKKETSSSKIKGMSWSTGHYVKSLKEDVELEEAVGDNHLHVQQVKHEGQTKYKVHAVGKNFADGIKVGEHLSDTELDDFSEMGGKIKHVKPAAAKPMKEARSLSAILDEARGRPSKKASEDEDEDDEGPDTGPEADQNIMVHLRKSTDTEGNHDVKFSDGSSHKVPAHVAHKVLGAMEKLKPADRAKIQSHIQQSHANLMAVHKMVS